jgi:hypothetical protein
MPSWKSSRFARRSRAPFLQVNAKVGELASPSAPQALVLLGDLTGIVISSAAIIDESALTGERRLASHRSP